MTYMGVILLILAANTPVAPSFGVPPPITIGQPNPAQNAFSTFLLGIAFLGSGVVVTLALPPIMQRRDKLPVMQQPC